MVRTEVRFNSNLPVAEVADKLEMVRSIFEQIACMEAVGARRHGHVAPDPNYIQVSPLLLEGDINFLIRTGIQLEQGIMALREFLIGFPRNEDGHIIWNIVLGEDGEALTLLTKDNAAKLAQFSYQYSAEQTALLEREGSNYDE